MYTNQTLSEKYRTIDQKVGISVDFNARRAIANAIKVCLADINAYYEREKSLQRLEIPGINLNRTNLNPRDVLEVLIEKGKQEAEQYAHEALGRIQEHNAGRTEATQFTVPMAP